MMKLLKRALLASAVMASLSAAADAQPVPPPGYPAIPPPRYEAVPVAPGTQYVWEPGHWFWNSRQYVWVGGHYIVRRPRYAQYVPGRWAPNGGAWVWVPAHWR